MMSDPATPSLESLVQLIAAAAPQPWYPFDYVREHSVPRERLDPYLDRLRLAGFVRLTDWVGGHGQGYALTPEGTKALEDPRYLAQLKNGQVPQLHAAPESGPTRPGPASAFERGEEIRQALLTPTSALVTKVLIAINVLVFVAGMGLAVIQGAPLNQYLVGSTPLITYQTGALTGSALLQGDWWRLLATCFVHFGFLHLAVNMYALYKLGPIAERLWGPRRFIVLYLLAGFGGSCAIAAFMPQVMGAGASGAICGVIGAEAGWLYLNRAYLPGPLVSSWARNLVINSLLIVFISSMPGISKEAHYGGAAVGLIVALLLNVQRFGSPAQRVLAVVGLLIVPVACVGFVVRSMHQSPEWQAGVRQYEAANFDGAYFDDLRSTMKALEDYQQQVEPLLGQHRQRRDAAAVERARSMLATRQKELEALAVRLEQQRPYVSPEVEQMRQVSHETVAASAQMFADADRALQAGPNWREDEKTLKQQQEKVEEAWKRWSEVRRTLLSRVKTK